MMSNPTQEWRGSKKAKSYMGFGGYLMSKKWNLSNTRGTKRAVMILYCNLDIQQSIMKNSNLYLQPSNNKSAIVELRRVVPEGCRL